MKFYLLLVYATAILVALYYLTLLLHIFLGIFGKNVSISKAFIPFYGWITGLKGEKNSQVEAPEAKNPMPQSASRRKNNKKL